MSLLQSFIIVMKSCMKNFAWYYTAPGEITSWSVQVWLNGMIVFFLSSISQALCSSFPLSFVGTFNRSDRIFHTGLLFQTFLSGFALPEVSSAFAWLIAYFSSDWLFRTYALLTTGTQCLSELHRVLRLLLVCCRYKKSMSLHWNLRKSLPSVHRK